jgi:hypothetical protein
MGKIPAESRCMFCNRPVIEDAKRLKANSRDDCNEVAAKLGAKVGDKLICKHCCSELVTMISSRLGS